MSRYVTLGADENGQVYGLELNEDGSWRRNPLGCSTSCAVMRPMTKDDVYSWEASGWFPPKRPFVIEFAPKELLEEYYAHLRKTYKEFEG